jgi:hypothetical protein
LKEEEELEARRMTKTKCSLEDLKYLLTVHLLKKSV